MEKFSILSFSTKKLLIYTIIAFVVTTLLTILTSIYIGEKVFPAIVFLSTIVISIFWIKKCCWTSYQIIIDNDKLFINNRNYYLLDIIKYTFEDTEKYYGLKLVFKSDNFFFNISKKNSLDYLAFKIKFIEAIDHLKENHNISVPKYDWYKTKSAKIYGYITALVLILWIIAMFVYPERLKISNIGLFFIVLAGLSPILLKIFRNNR
ncbi:hypothetical protein ACTJIV_19930 [Chryseobacterium sp. 22532]|jgi:hypothetical protein|uniref:hypothetical protein n=1 Tax=Chryseobacterium sp. 22532 TaxID=3453938 RepID=UPI003F84AD85